MSTSFLSAPLRLSHDELLLLLGLLRLPPPLALGSAPVAGYTDATLSAALRSALGSLVARGLVSATPGTQPLVDPSLRSLLAAMAQPEAVLMLTVRAPAAAWSVHYGWRDRQCYRLSSPFPRVYELVLLDHADAVVADLLERIGPAPAVAETPVWQVDAAALRQAVDAAAAGSANPGQPLAAAGCSEAAAAFTAHFGPATVRFALAALRDLARGRASGRGIVLLRGTGALWCAAEGRVQPALVEVGPVDQAGLRAALSGLVEPLWQEEGNCADA